MKFRPTVVEWMIIFAIGGILTAILVPACSEDKAIKHTYHCDSQEKAKIQDYLIKCEGSLEGCTKQAAVIFACTETTTEVVSNCFGCGCGDLYAITYQAEANSQF